MEDLAPYLSILRTIKSKDPSKAIAQEYGYLTYLYGERGEDWKLRKQILTTHTEPDGSITPVDVFQIVLADGKEVEVWIDISSFYKHQPTN
jgi:hypothetical protein